LIGRTSGGVNDVTIINSYTSGNISGTSANELALGGLVGVVSANGAMTIIDSYSTADIKSRTTVSTGNASPKMGGLIGDTYLATLTIDNSYYRGSLESFNATQNLPSLSGGLVARVGGAVELTITNSFAYSVAQTNENNNMTKTGGLIGGFLNSEPTNNFVNNAFYSGSVNVAQGDMTITGFEH